MLAFTSASSERPTPNVEVSVAIMLVDLNPVTRSQVWHKPNGRYCHSALHAFCPCIRPTPALGVEPGLTGGRMQRRDDHGANYSALGQMGISRQCRIHERRNDLQRRCIPIKKTHRFQTKHHRAAPTLRPCQSTKDGRGGSDTTMPPPCR